MAPSAITPKTIAPSNRVAAIDLFGLGANIGLFLARPILFSVALYSRGFRIFDLQPMGRAPFLLV
jgi:hypothetical protein